MKIKLVDIYSLSDVAASAMNRKSDISISGETVHALVASAFCRVLFPAIYLSSSLKPEKKRCATIPMEGLFYTGNKKISYKTTLSVIEDLNNGTDEVATLEKYLKYRAYSSSVKLTNRAVDLIEDQLGILSPGDDFNDYKNNDFEDPIFRSAYCYFATQPPLDNIPEFDALRDAVTENSPKSYHAFLRSLHVLASNTLYQDAGDLYYMFYRSTTYVLDSYNTLISSLLLSFTAHNPYYAKKAYDLLCTLEYFAPGLKEEVEKLSQQQSAQDANIRDTSYLTIQQQALPILRLVLSTVKPPILREEEQSHQKLQGLEEVIAYLLLLYPEQGIASRDIVILGHNKKEQYVRVINKERYPPDNISNICVDALSTTSQIHQEVFKLVDDMRKILSDLQDLGLNWDTIIDKLRTVCDNLSKPEVSIHIKKLIHKNLSFRKYLEPSDDLVSIIYETITYRCRVLEYYLKNKEILYISRQFLSARYNDNMCQIAFSDFVQVSQNLQAQNNADFFELLGFCQKGSCLIKEIKITRLEGHLPQTSPTPIQACSTAEAEAEGDDSSGAWLLANEKLIETGQQAIKRLASRTMSHSIKYCLERYRAAIIVVSLAVLVAVIVSVVIHDAKTLLPWLPVLVLLMSLPVAIAHRYSSCKKPETYVMSVSQPISAIAASIYNNNQEDSLPTSPD